MDPKGESKSFKFTKKSRLTNLMIVERNCIGLGEMLVHAALGGSKVKSVNLGKRETPGLMAATPALAEELRITLPDLSITGKI